MHNIKIELYFYNSILKVTKMYPGEPITKKLSKMSTGEPITIFLRVNQLGLMGNWNIILDAIIVLLYGLKQ